MSEEEIYGIITVAVPEEIREVILKLFGPVKTVLIEEFDKRYVAISQVAIPAATIAVSFAGS